MFGSIYNICSSFRASPWRAPASCSLVSVDSGGGPAARDAVLEPLSVECICPGARRLPFGPLSPTAAPLVSGQVLVWLGQMWIDVEVCMDMYIDICV